MITHVLHFHNGTEIASGASSSTAYLQNVDIKRAVNSEEDLKLGSVCSAQLTATLITPGGEYSFPRRSSVSDDIDVEVFSVDDAGVRSREGGFLLSKPERISANKYRLTGYDVVSKLDQDIAAKINAFTNWPLPIKYLATNVCGWCGVPFLNYDDLPFGNVIQINKFTVQTVTARQIMQYIGEICAVFFRSAMSGSIGTTYSNYLEPAWYESSGISLGPSAGTGVTAYKSGTLSYADYQVAPIERVALLQADGTVLDYYDVNHEGDVDDLNTYTISDNCVLAAMSRAHRILALHAIYDRLYDFSYTPCSASLWVPSGLKVGDLVSVTAPNGDTFDTLIMSTTSSGQREDVESTGNEDRRCPEAMNSSDYQHTATPQPGSVDIVCKFG